MKQKHLEDLYRALIQKDFTIKEALHSQMTLVVTSEVKLEVANALIDALNDAEDNENNSRVLHANVLIKLLEDYREYHAEADTGLYGYYDTEDGSEVEEGRIPFNRMLKHVTQIYEQMPSY